MLAHYFTILILLLVAICNQQKVDSWFIDKPIFEAGKQGSFDEIAVKDPSILFFENKWHLFYTARDSSEYTTGYVSAEKLSELQNASRHELGIIRGESRYGCAPQVFFFEPQKKWYLIFQTRDSNYQPAFSTTKSISNPNSWSKAQNLIEKDSRKKWIDFWIIADQHRVYLFYTEAHFGVMVRSTSTNNFPNGWGKSRLVLENIHEAVHVYKVKEKNEFHMIYELNTNGIRSFGLAKANHLEGPWKKETDDYASNNQLILSKNVEPWTEMISHGELIRSNYNEFMEYEPYNCQWLIQGLLKKELKKEYTMLPWKLGIIKQMQNAK